LPPLHFLTEPEVFQGVIDERVVLAARRREKLVAYLVASPIPGRNGYLIEELARSRQAPNGASELLIDSAMRMFGAAGHRYVTLGLVALARDVFSESPVWLRSLMYFARAHANRFYNFRGLEQFRAKLGPVAWEEIYLISRERHFSPRTLYAVGGAFSGISPVRAIAIGLLTALRAEWRRLISGKGPAAAPPIRRARRVA
jgi:phosphatidylglycerol lysyltransferase